MFNIFGLVACSKQGLSANSCLSDVLDAGDFLAEELFEYIVNKRIAYNEEWLELHGDGYYLAQNGSKGVFCIRGLSLILEKSRFLIHYNFSAPTPLIGDMLDVFDSSDVGMKFSPLQEFTGGRIFRRCDNAQGITKVAFLGNSLTVHGQYQAQLPSLGWYGEWGMVASAKKNNYVHKNMFLSGEGIDFNIYSVKCWECSVDRFNYSSFNDIAKANPDVMIINIG